MTEDISRPIILILNSSPSWMVKWGITFVLSIIIAFIGLSTLIDFPEVIKIPSRVIFRDPQEPLLPGVNGKIERIFVKTSENVIKSQILATIMHNDQSTEAQVLQKALKQLLVCSDTALITLIKQLTFYTRDPETISNNINQLLKLTTQLNLITSFKRDKRALTACRSFSEEILEWNVRYILRSDRDGTIILPERIRPGQYILKDNPVFYINKSTSFSFELKIPQNLLHKIQMGQRGNIEMISYSAEEFGTVKAQVDYVSEIADRDGYYKANMKILTYNRKIILKVGLTGTAIIKIADKSLFTTMFKDFNYF